MTTELNYPERPLLDFHGWYLGQTPIRVHGLSEDQLRAKLPELTAAYAKVAADNEGKVAYLEVSESEVRAQPQAWVKDLPKLTTATTKELCSFLDKHWSAGDYVQREAKEQDLLGYPVKFTANAYSALTSTFFAYLELISSSNEQDARGARSKMKFAYSRIPKYLQEAMGPLPEDG